MNSLCWDQLHVISVEHAWNEGVWIKYFPHQSGKRDGILEGYCDSLHTPVHHTKFFVRKSDSREDLAGQTPQSSGWGGVFCSQEYGSILGFLTVADIRRKIFDACPSLGPIFFIFMQFSGIFGQIIGWRSPHVGAPLGNPGSAAVCFTFFPTNSQPAPLHHR